MIFGSVISLNDDTSLGLRTPRRDYKSFYIWDLYVEEILITTNLHWTEDLLVDMIWSKVSHWYYNFKLLSELLYVNTNTDKFLYI